MNKKFLTYGLIGLFSLMLVTGAILSYYGQIQQDIEVKSPIIVSPDTSVIIDDIWAGIGGVREGKLITIENIADFGIDVEISNDANEEVGINVSYEGALELTKKIVDFNLDVWEVLEDKVQIEYTIVGNKFSAEVVEGEEITDYVLIYYADNLDRFNNVAKAISIDTINENLPYFDDENAEGGDYNYCDTEEYLTCHGAKIWYVPSEAIDGDGNIAWDRASDFYFESSLIQYNSDGQIMVYPDEVLDFTPVYTIAPNYIGSSTITTEVLPA